MKHEALIKRLEVSCLGLDAVDPLRLLVNDVVAALREPEQEPVVFYRCNGCGHAYEQVQPTSCDCMESGGFDRVEYYTTPPQRTWVGLTDEKIHNLDPLPHQMFDTQRIEFARAIEAAHGIKENT
jgi:hypothetical protein